MSDEQPPQVAVWYFVGATFVFSAPVLWFDDPQPWVTILFFAVGLVAMVCGGIRLGREIKGRQARKDAPPSQG